uniref:Uncharacterized protein n=1 Tax=Tanacetum cinerariifolium TaxID=118510 RepID=A0A699HNG6_TANCI|nr:hypothetical protein [Tanacetum cinerariifolium]
MLTFLREWIQVAVPGAKKPWEVLLPRLGLRECLNSPMNHLSQKVTHLKVGREEWSNGTYFELTDPVPPTPHDSPLTGGYIPESDEEKDAQAVEILNLKKRVKKLERKRKSSISHSKRRKYKQVESSNDDLDEEDASKQGRISDKTKLMFQDNDFDGLHDAMQDVERGTVDAATTGVSTINASVTTAGVTISTAEPRTPPTETTVFDDADVTMAMAQTLIKMREEKAKEKGVVLKDAEDSFRPIRSITTLKPLPSINPKDKGKGVLVEGEHMGVKIKDQGQMQEEATIAVLAEEYDEIQATMDADEELDARLTLEEQENYTIKERKLEEEYSPEKEELRANMDIGPKDDILINVESLATKADGNSKNYKIFSEMLDDFDRQDVIDLYSTVRAIKDIYATNEYSSKRWLVLPKEAELTLPRTLTLKITCSCLNDVDEDLKDQAMCDFSYDALCTHWLSLKRVTLLRSVSRFIGRSMILTFSALRRVHTRTL